MITLTIFLLVFVISSGQAHRGRQKISKDILEDQLLTTLELVKKYGYQGEKHVVQTEDGYILEIHRILPLKSCKNETKVVLALHGLTGSSADWVVMGPGQSLPYLLSDACYDVWLGNSRGSTYSLNHTTHDIKSVEFWDFTFHEMGIYDLPPMIDYILNQTANENLIYIGYSQGNTAFFIFNTILTEYQPKIKISISTGPSALLEHGDSMIHKILSPNLYLFEGYRRLFGLRQLTGNKAFFKFLAKYPCAEFPPPFAKVCCDILTSNIGFNETQVNITLLPLMFAHSPAPAATKILLHYAQIHKSGKFQMFDYGPWDNMKHYAQISPPEYQLEKAKTPAVFYYSKGDVFEAPKDVKRFYSMLPNQAGIYLVPLESFTHFDFMWGLDAKKYVYEPMIKIMNSL